MIADAVLSDCGRYRYQLIRDWRREIGQDQRVACWVMLNPSTADASADDPTVRRCIGFTRRICYGALVVVNLYALRATNPAELKQAPDPVGPKNLWWVKQTLLSSDIVIAAWGRHRPPTSALSNLLETEPALFCFGTTKEGYPRHPLYLPKAAPCVPYRWLP